MNRRIANIFSWNNLACVSSAALLLFSFPPLDQKWFAWFALVPLISVLHQKISWRDSFRAAYATGLLFFGGLLFWLGYVTALGTVMLVLYLALYFGLFGAVYHWFRRYPLAARLLALPSLWVCLEFLRGYLLTGFDWGSLGHSQYLNTSLIQIASVTGVFGISFLVMFVNAAIWEGFFNTHKGMTRFIVIIVTVGLLAGARQWGEGMMKLSAAKGEKIIRLALIQGNVEQFDKWDMLKWPEIFEKYLSLSDAALAEDPDLIVWPETAYPDIWESSDDETFRTVRDFARASRTPLLLGAAVHEQEQYFNSALFLDERGEMRGRYDKIHLVAFGEFVPLRRYWDGLARYIPIVDFTPGKDHVVFDIHGVKVAALICFEDTIARVVRPFVLNGAQVLVNMTNDAWYGKTQAAYVHMIGSVLRAVENRRPVVRAANTGVTALIDAQGRIKEMLTDRQGGSLFISGQLVASVPVSDQGITFYTRYGDVFVWFCAGILILCFTAGFLREKRK